MPTICFTFPFIDKVWQFLKLIVREADQLNWRTPLLCNLRIEWHEFARCPR